MKGSLQRRVRLKNLKSQARRVKRNLQRRVHLKNLRSQARRPRENQQKKAHQRSQRVPAKKLKKKHQILPQMNQRDPLKPNHLQIAHLIQVIKKLKKVTMKAVMQIHLLVKIHKSHPLELMKVQMLINQAKHQILKKQICLALMQAPVQRIRVILR